jgi:hypothetical protein
MPFAPSRRGSFPRDRVFGLESGGHLGDGSIVNLTRSHELRLHAFEPRSELSGHRLHGPDLGSAREGRKLPQKSFFIGVQPAHFGGGPLQCSSGVLESSHGSRLGLPMRARRTDRCRSVVESARTVAPSRSSVPRVGSNAALHRRRVVQSTEQTGVRRTPRMLAAQWPQPREHLPPGRHVEFGRSTSQGRQRDSTNDNPQRNSAPSQAQRRNPQVGDDAAGRDRRPYLAK